MVFCHLSKLLHREDGFRCYCQEEMSGMFPLKMCLVLSFCVFCFVFAPWVILEKANHHWQEQGFISPKEVENVDPLGVIKA